MIKFYNLHGELSSSGPFQLFGPVPFPGSWLCIHSPELPVAPSEAISITINWLQLPSEGFAKYYEQYDSYQINNGTVKVHFYYCCDGELFSCPTATDYDLFQAEVSDNTTLAPSSTFRNIEFSARPHLPPEIPKFGFDRYIVMVLTQPSWGFGHMIFPSIFSTVVLNNAKIAKLAQRWYFRILAIFLSNKNKKARPLPNQPYTPLVSSLLLEINC